MLVLNFRKLEDGDHVRALDVINGAALWYREFLPPEEHHDPEMTLEQWREEGRRMTWFGADLDGTLVGVMGLEPIGDAALIRHAYVLPAFQHQGVGAELLRHLEGEAGAVKRLVVGTYAANYKARAMFERNGYRLSDDSEAVLRQYYAIPEERLRSSVTYEKTLV
jgi:GNAT superfamily N-acetyltransferase